jgi:nitroreductase
MASPGTAFGAATKPRKHEPVPPPTSLRSVVELATRAPSAWNSQPWKFKIGEDTVEIHADRSRSLGAADPQDRELVISCGAAITNLRVALSRAGYAWLLDTLPVQSNPTLLGRMSVRRPGSSSRENDLLYQAIPRRFSVTGRFKSKPVPATLLNSLATLAAEEHAWLEFITGDWERREAAEILARGERAFWKEPEVRRAAGAWVKLRESGEPDGMDPSALGFGWLGRRSAPAMVRRISHGRRFARRARSLALQAPVIAVLGTRKDDPRAWLSAGQALQRFLLRAAAEDIQAGFFSALTHEIGCCARLAELIGADGHPQLVLRLGYADAPRRPSPRRTWEGVIL